MKHLDNKVINYKSRNVINVLKRVTITHFTGVHTDKIEYWVGDAAKSIFLGGRGIRHNDSRNIKIPEGDIDEYGESFVDNEKGELENSRGSYEYWYGYGRTLK